MKKNATRQLIPSLISISIVLMLASLGFTVYNRQVMLKNTEIKQKAEFIKKATADLHFRGVKSSDLTVRGYALVQSEHYQQMPVVRKVTQQNFDTLKVLLKSENHDLKQFEAVKDTILKYYDFQEYMMTLAEKDSMTLFKSLFKDDKGDKVWAFYNEFAQVVNNTEDALLAQAQDDYQQALNGNIIVQIFMVVIGVPTLLLVLIWLHREQKTRQKLLLNLQKNNQEYLFDDGKLMSSKEITDQAIIDETVKNLQQAARFVQDLAKGDYHTKWDGWKEVKHLPANQQNLTGALQEMKLKLKNLKDENEQRMWANQGLTQLSSIIRTHQQEPQELLQKSLSFITRYLASQRAAIYLSKHNQDDEIILELRAAFGLDAKELIKKEFVVGEGLIGQVYKEGKVKVFENIPNDYFRISSGLGKVKPSGLIIIPLQWNNITGSVLELASLQPFSSAQLDFLEKAGEYLGSAIAFNQNNQSSDETRIKNEY